MKVVLEAMDFLEPVSINHKLHLATMRPHTWPFVQVDILLRPELFVISRAKTWLKLVPWNSSTPCFLTKSIRARGVVSRSKTIAIS